MTSEHENHDVVTYNEQFEYSAVNRGIYWCKDCEEELTEEDLNDE